MQHGGGPHGRLSVQRFNTIRWDGMGRPRRPELPARLDGPCIAQMAIWVGPLLPCRPCVKPPRRCCPALVVSRTPAWLPRLAGWCRHVMLADPATNSVLAWGGKLSLADAEAAGARARGRGPGGCHAWWPAGGMGWGLGRHQGGEERSGGTRPGILRGQQWRVGTCTSLAHEHCALRCHVPIVRRHPAGAIWAFLCTWACRLGLPRAAGGV